MFCGIRVAQSVDFGVVFCKSLFVFFLLVIVLSVIFQFTDSDYPFGTFWYIQFFLVIVCVAGFNRNSLFSPFFFKPCILLKILKLINSCYLENKIQTVNLRKYCEN